MHRANPLDFDQSDKIVTAKKVETFCRANLEGQQ
jgi:hypothetical protein